MALNGYFFDGTTLGQSSLAPYSDEELANAFARFGNFVIEDYESELKVTQSATLGVVDIGAGAAMVFGSLFINDSVATRSVTAATNNRIDVIVLRRDSAGQTVRVSRVQGVEAANPTIPAIGANDFALAWVWLDAGYNPAASSPLDINIHDMRDFNRVITSQTATFPVNLVPNSEFLIYSDTTQNPEEWLISAGTVAITTQITNARSRSLSFIAAAAGNGFTTGIHLQDNNYYVLKGSIYITSGSVNIEIINAVISGGPGTLQKRFYQTGSIINYIIRFQPSNAGGITQFRFLSNGGAATFHIGQQMVIAGNVAGNFFPQQEILLARQDLIDSNWNMTAKSTGTTQVDLSTAFSGRIGTYIRGLILGMRGRDSGSAANPVKMGLYSNISGATNNLSQLTLEGEPNDAIRERIGYVPINHFVSQGYFNVGVAASGGGTFDAELRLLGVIT